MCFDHDSRPPIVPNPSGMRDSRAIELTSEDGTRFAAHLARATRPTGTGVVILPDVRGLHQYYRELAERFAEHGVDAVAIDYFGRTAGISDRGEGFEHAPHVAATKYAALMADARAGGAALREEANPQRVYTIGFCMGGRLAFLTAAQQELDLAGVIGFYGFPTGAARNDTPAPADLASSFTCPVLGIFGGADQAISAESIGAFGQALTAARIEHRLETYAGAPHSFFDRKAAEFAEASERAWAETLGFMGVAT